MTQIGFSAIKDIVQTLFFLTIGTITFLTYRKARRTLLQPIRTEVFKEQIKIFTEILSFFTGKREIDLRNDLAFKDLLIANSFALFDDYARHFFDIEIDRDKRPYSPKLCPVAIVSRSTLEKDFEREDGYLQRDSKPAEKTVSDPRTRAATWSKYEYGMVNLPEVLVNKQKELKLIMDSPLLPDKLIELLEEYDKAIYTNINILSELLTEASQEMPEKYPTLELGLKASSHWIHSRYNQRMVHFEPIAKKVTAYIRGYFTSDKLFDY